MLSLIRSPDFLYEPGRSLCLKIIHGCAVLLEEKLLQDFDRLLFKSFLPGIDIRLRPGPGIVIFQIHKIFVKIFAQPGQGLIDILFVGQNDPVLILRREGSRKSGRHDLTESAAYGFKIAGGSKRKLPVFHLPFFFDLHKGHALFVLFL